MSNENNYYEETLTKIKDLMKDNLQKANALLDVELNMPYIPEKYEAEFVKLKDEVVYKQNEFIKNSTLSEEQVIEYLYSKDEIKEAAAIESLSKINVRNIRDKIIRWVDKFGHDKPVARAFIYEVFVDQEIDVELEFEGINLNPTKNKSILDDHQVKIALTVFEDQVNDSPHMLKPLIDEFRYYLLNSFPNLPKDGETFAIDFAQAFKAMFDEKIELTEIQKEIQKVIKS